MIKKILVLFLLTLGLSVYSVEASAKIHLILLSGQSNMNFFDDEKFFTPIVKAAFPGDTVLVAKFAQNGRPIRRWDKEWRDSRGRAFDATDEYYDRLLNQVHTVLGNRKPDSVSFVWMQGEADGSGGFGKVYQQSLERIISHLKHDLATDRMAVVIGRISDRAVGTPKEASWDEVRQAQERVADSQTFGAWINTDDLNDWHNPNPNAKIQQMNLLHYTHEGYRKLGQRFAEQVIQLIKKMEK